MKGIYFVLFFLFNGFSCNSVTHQPRFNVSDSFGNFSIPRDFLNVSDIFGNVSRSNFQKDIDVSSLVAGTGRSRHVRQVEPLKCGSTDNLKDGEYTMIESQNYPQNYPNKHKCVWNIVLPENSGLYFSCESFDLARRDYLAIGGSLNIRLSGSTSDYFGFTMPIGGRKINMQFVTNKKKSGKGFRCYIDVYSYSTPETTAAPTGATTAGPTAGPSTSTCGLANKSDRIVGGVETEANEYPWQVGLVSASGSHPWCGGTLISSQHVLTAAHCTDGAKPKNIAVLLGEHKIDDSDYNRVSISKITDHPDYNSGTLDNDFSILTLSSPVTFTREVSPACLPANTSTFAGEKATVSGWGTLASGGNQPTTLNEVEVTVQTNEACNSAYGGGITSNMICAADAGKDSCQGDSGGPMVVQENGRFALVGVVSWGYGCAMAQYPGVYARVTAQMDFILANTVGTQTTL